eukprot:72993_1
MSSAEESRDNGNMSYSDSEGSSPKPKISARAVSSLRGASEKEVHKRLSELGVKNPENVSDCLKRSIQAGFVWLDDRNDGVSPLDRILTTVTCIWNCSEKIDVTVRDVLHQPNYGGDYEDGSEGASVQCEGEECGGIYITGMCVGDFDGNDGKSHNHCTECPGFGTCIGDYREAHCEKCGNHYFRGLSGLPCQDCGDSEGSDAVGWF